MLINPAITGLSCYSILFCPLSCFALVGTLMGMIVGMRLGLIRTGSTLSPITEIIFNPVEKTYRRAILFYIGGFRLNNNTTPEKNLQEQSNGQNVNFHTLDMVSVNALVPLTLQRRALSR